MKPPGLRFGTAAETGRALHANASRDANLDHEQLARRILEEAAEIDAHEDELYGDARGDELPPTLARREGRRAWLREARQRLENQRAANPKPVPRSRPTRLREAKRRLEEELQVECEANADYEAYRAGGVDKTGRRFGRPPDPVQMPDTPTGKVNTTDPDSRLLKARRGFVQGYNAQAVVNEHGIVLAAEIMTEGADFGHLEPMLNAARRELLAAGISEQPQVTLADAGYWHQPQMESIVSHGTQVLIRRDGDQRKGIRPGWNGGYYASMRSVLDSELGGSLYRKRKTMIEPIFGHTKYNRRADRFQRRGRGAARSQWRLITATHNPYETPPPTDWRPQRPEPPPGPSRTAASPPTPARSTIPHARPGVTRPNPRGRDRRFLRRTRAGPTLYATASLAGLPATSQE